MSGHKERKESSIYNLRVFHNWIKRELITQAANHLRENYNIQNPKLLDLAVGKGGDIGKFLDNHVTNMIGFDIDNGSIMEAKKRYEQMKRENMKKGGAPLNYRFYVIDLSKKENLPEINILIRGMKFDIVSCQFAIHYFFKNEDSLENLIKIAGSYINKNGFFIGTTVNGDMLKKIFVNTKIIETDLFKIENMSTQLDQDYGNKYLVSLGSKDDKGHYFVGKPSEEYLVSLEILKKVCSKYNLMYIGSINFDEWYSSYNKETLSPNEKEYSFLNFSFVFMKK